MASTTVKSLYYKRSNTITIYMSELFVILILLVFSVAISKCEANLISSFCSRTDDPSLCERVVRSDPRSRVANARGLGKIALGNAESLTRASIGVAKSVSNPGNERIIDTCIDVFNIALRSLKACEGFIQKPDNKALFTLRDGLDVIFQEFKPNFIEMRFKR